MSTGESDYFAKGERTGKAGLFLARRVDQNGKPLGVIIVKVEFEEVTELWKELNTTTFVTNSDDIILFSSDSSLNFSTLQPLSEAQKQEVLETKQFGSELLSEALLVIGPDLMGVDSKDRDIQATVLAIPELGWKIYRTELIAPALEAANRRILLQLLSAALVVVCLGLFMISRLSRERQRAQTTKFLTTEVARQTKELSDTNKQLEFEMNEREKFNERFRIAREDLAQANRLGSIGAITASVAHEINQPVSAIRAFAENAVKLLARAETSRAEQNIVSIVELTTKIGNITNELRRYARRGTLLIGQVSICDVADGAELLIGDRIVGAGVDFTVVGAEPTLPLVKAGRVRLEQVLVNVLQNALEAVAETPSPKIEMRIGDEGKFVSITVTDNGPGIEDSVASEVFTPFFTKKPQGLGIGLGIAKDIMSEFGGSIELVASKLGGAAFKLKVQKI